MLLPSHVDDNSTLEITVCFDTVSNESVTPHVRPLLATEHVHLKNKREEIELLESKHGHNRKQRDIISKVNQQVSTSLSAKSLSVNLYLLNYKQSYRIMYLNFDV